MTTDYERDREPGQGIDTHGLVGLSLCRRVNE